MSLQNLSRAAVEQRGSRGANGGNPARVLGAFDLYVNEKDKSLCNHLMNDGFWESWTTAWMSRVIEPGMFCLDVGANYGYVTGLMASIVGPEGKVWAFEPATHAVSCLLKSVSRNKWQDTTTIFPYGLSDSTGQAEFFVTDEYAGGASFVIETPYGIESPGTVRKELAHFSKLDTHVIPRKVDFVKIDVEGLEPLVLEGMKETIKRDNPLITIELLPPALEQRYPWFLADLFDKWNVFNIDTDGNEVQITYDQVFSENWWMVALRRKNG